MVSAGVCQIRANPGDSTENPAQGLRVFLTRKLIFKSPQGHCRRAVPDHFPWPSLVSPCDPRRGDSLPARKATWIPQLGPHRASEPALTLSEKLAAGPWLAAPSPLDSPQGWTRPVRNLPTPSPTLSFLLPQRDVRRRGCDWGVGSEHRRRGLELVESFVGDLATQPWPSPRGQPRTPGALGRQGLVLLCALSSAA